VVAGFEPISYDIVYRLNGGTNHPENPATYTIASPTIVCNSSLYHV